MMVLGDTPIAITIKIDLGAIQQSRLASVHTYLYGGAKSFPLWVRAMAGMPNRESEGDSQTARTLCRADWIDVARSLLVEEGIAAVRITRLAALLEVTRGSFYWHFESRQDLLDALLADWAQRNTRAIIEAVEAADDLIDAVLAFFDCWMEQEDFLPRLDSAMRDWARQDEAVKLAVREADEARIRVLTDAFEKSGLASQPALIRARILYFAQVGYYALDIAEALEERFKYLEDYVLGFTGRGISAPRAAAHRRRYAVTDPTEGKQS